MNVKSNMRFVGIEGFDTYRRFIEMMIKGQNHPDAVSFLLGVNEAICNALRYSESGPELAKVKIKTRFNDRFLIVRITSDSPGFNIREYVENFKDLSDMAECRSYLKKQKRGRGLLLMLVGSKKVIFNASGNSVTLLTDLKFSPVSSQNEKLLSRLVIRAERGKKHE